MTPPRSSDQSEGFRAKNRPSLTTYASIARPAVEIVYGLTLLAGRRNGCSATSTEGRNQPLDDLWLPECDKSATTCDAGRGQCGRWRAGPRTDKGRIEARPWLTGSRGKDSDAVSPEIGQQTPEK